MLKNQAAYTVVPFSGSQRTMHSLSNQDILRSLPKLMDCLNQKERFSFESSAVRGNRVFISTMYQQAIAQHDYPPTLRKLVGETLAAALMISSTLKFKGTLALQAQSAGPVQLIVAECTHDGRFRALARWNHEEQTDGGIRELLAGGQLAITITPEKGQRYQSLIAIDSDTLSGCLSSYFERSEQLATRLWLACDGNVASGLLLQALPQKAESTEKNTSPMKQSSSPLQPEDWVHYTTMAATLKKTELLTLETSELLKRLFAGDSVRLHDASQVAYQCSCSRQRLLNALLSIEADELKELLVKEPFIETHCEFCNTAYKFTANDLNITI